MQIPNQHGQKEELQITKDEFRKIEKAMKKPEFAELMGDYMKEISDPKNRAEYDEYLKQLEKEKELPQNMKLIKPDPHFCIKTTIWSKTNRKNEQKFFINICSASCVEQASFENVTRDGTTGQQWRLPYTIGKIRYDQDRKGVICNTVDVAFHPLTIGHSHKTPGFQSLVCSTAIDASQKQLGERNEDISKDYKLLKHTKCKGGEPALLPVRLDRKGKMNNTELDGRQGGLKNAQTHLQKEINGLKQEAQPQKVDEPEEEEIIKESDEVESKAVQQPKHRFIYSYPVEYSDFLDSNANRHKLPETLGCDVKMPKTESIKEINLDLSNQNLILDVPLKYYLDIKLPYPIDSDEGTAKFDPKTKTLKIRVPISKSYIKEQQLLELNRIKESQIQEDLEKDTEVAEQAYGVQFIENNQNPIIEELTIENKNIEDIASVSQEQQEEFIQISYRTRLDENTLFIIANLKDYDQNLTQVLFNETELLIYFKLQFKNYYLHLTAQNKSFIIQQSDKNYVKDYVVLKLKQINNDPVNLTVIDYQDQPFIQFLSKLDQLKDEQKQFAELLQKERVEAQQSQSIQKSEVQSEEINKQISEPQQQDKKEVQQAPPADEPKDDQAPQNQRKFNIQFINFQQVIPEAFDID